MNFKPCAEQLDRQISIYANQSFEGKKRFIEKFVTLKCAPDLLALEVFPNAKEITESMAAMHAIKKYCLGFLTLNDPSVHVVVVADGNSPRTGALMAFMSNWTVTSIDPRLKEKWVKTSKIQRLECIDMMLENIPLTDPIIAKTKLVVGVHTHVTYETMKEYFPNTPWIIIPCCVPYPEKESTHYYREPGIWSPENQVLLYNFPNRHVNEKPFKEKV